MVNPVLARLYSANVVVHRDGRTLPLCPPAMTGERGEYLFRLIRALRPRQTLEIGFAYGVSTLFIAEALRQNGNGQHIAIDPNEHARFDGLGLRHLDEAGLRDRVTFFEEPAELCLPRLVQEGLQLDLALNDSGHLFDHVILESVFLARLLRVGGVLVFDDPLLPGVRRACDFLATNRRDLAEVEGGEEQRLASRLLGRRAIPPPPTNVRGKPLMRVFLKTAATDPRDWNDYTPF
jgi:predicted O-methyltransferase YrrM